MLLEGLYLFSSLAVLSSGRPQSRPRPSCLSAHRSGITGATPPSSFAPIIAGMVTSPATTTTTTATDVTTTTATATAAVSAKPTSFYRRVLKPPCVAFSSADGRKLFREALVEGNMESYFRLAEQFRTQDDPAFCGLSTLTMVLNALAVDPGRTWKGPWRWYHESMLDCCAPLETVRAKGITLNTLGCLARCNGLKVEMGGPSTHSLEDLRAVIEECSSEDMGKVVVVSYDRRGLKQTGSGHFSPIGGFHKSEDLVLIMDTARFKLPPHWAPLSTLWEAMKRHDPETGKPRGFMVLEKGQSLSHRLFTANSGNHEDWPKVAAWVQKMIELASAPGDGGSPSDPAFDCGKELRQATTVTAFVPVLLARLPPVVRDLLTTFTSTVHPASVSGLTQDAVVLRAIQGTEAYQELMRMDRDDGASSITSSNNNKNNNNDNTSASIGSGGTGVSTGSCGSTGGEPSGKVVQTPSSSSFSSLPSSTSPEAPLAASCPSPSPPTTSSSSSSSSSLTFACPDRSGCGCSSRHVLSIISYALLLLLHEHDTDGCGCGGGSGGGGGGTDEESERVEPIWRKNPLASLPETVVDEAVHVAGMFRGLMHMEGCEKFALSSCLADR